MPLTVKIQPILAVCKCGLLISSLYHKIFCVCILIFTTQTTWTTGTEKQKAEQDVAHVGGPEGKQVECLVAVRIPAYCLIVVGFIDGVDPHISSNEPAEEEE